MLLSAESYNLKMAWCDRSNLLTKNAKVAKTLLGQLRKQSGVALLIVMVFVSAEMFLP